MKMSIMTGFNPDDFCEVSIINENNECIPYHQTLPVKNVSDDVQIKPGAGYIIKYHLEEIIHEDRVHPLASNLYLSHIREDLIKAGIKCPVNRSVMTSEEFSKNI